VLLVVGLVLVFFLATSLRGIAGFWTDYLWYDSLGLSEIFTGVIGAQVTLVLAFSFLFFIILFANLTIADRLAPKFRPAGPEELLLARYQDVMGRRAGTVRALISLVLGLMFGASAGTEWNNWILFTHRQEFGVNDPEFGKDIGFYVFQLPFYSFLVEWLFVSLVIVLLIVVGAHYLNGGIRMQSPFQRVTPQVKAHLSVLLAATALVKAADYWLQRFELLFSDRGVIDGAGYTDLEAQLPALDLLILISLAACVLFIINIWRRGWVLPSVAVGLWMFAALIAGTAYPAVIQRFVVEPQESAREAPYIERNIEATRAALGVDDIRVEEFEYQPVPTGEQLIASEDTVRNLRILDPAIVRLTFDREQAGRGFYEFADLDVDRYPIDGEQTQVVVAARELNIEGAQRQSWEAQHAAYTHGYGLVLAPSNEVTSTGNPNFLVQDMPVDVDPSVPISLESAQIYVGEGLGGYALVGTDLAEIDYVDETGQEISDRAYEGDGGVAASGSGFAGFMRRSAFALRFGEIDPLISDFMTPEARVIYVRDVRERVEKVAPFFDFDADPYPVVVDGRIHYVIDGYATTSLYPYAEQISTSQLTSRSGLKGENFNYVRNSVKAVVDAYDGEVTLFVMDDSDPITRAYREAFPDLFADREELPEELEAHLRYPDDLFTVQTAMWGRYRVDDPDTFYRETEAWEVAQDPGTLVRAGATTDAATPPSTDAQGNPIPDREQRIPPYFLETQLPGQEESSFVSLRPFVRASSDDAQKLLAGFMVAGSDPGEYGQLTVYSVSEAVDGPALVAAAIEADEVVSRTITPLNQQGSQAVYGNMTVVPIGQSLLYVRPLYISASGDTQVPQLQYIILVLDDKVVIGESMPEALALLFRASDGEVIDQDALDALADIFAGLPAPPPDDPDDPDDPEPSENPAELLAQADALFDDAEQILEEMDGLEDLGEYQDTVEEAQALVRQALAILEEQGLPVGEPSDSDDEDGDGTTTTTEAEPDPDDEADADSTTTAVAVSTNPDG
jgi:uncharacterized membrane protein (UPF0182 family)